MLPFADVLYACDEKWWDVSGPTEFAGEKWSSHHPSPRINDMKTDCASRHGLKLMEANDGHGFGADVLHYGHNSGFQAVNLAILFGAVDIRLVGFDMRPVGNKRHFFGDHPDPLSNHTDFKAFIAAFETAARMMPDGVRITNCTPESALRCFGFGSIHYDRHSP